MSPKCQTIPLRFEFWALSVRKLAGSACSPRGSTAERVGDKDRQIKSIRVAAEKVKTVLKQQHIRHLPRGVALW